MRGTLGIPLEPPFSKVEIRFDFSKSIKKALLPLKKGALGEFWGKPF
jgi:hypothetical protein